MNYLIKQGLKKCGFIIVIFCLALVSFACSKKEDKIETVEAKPEIRNLPDGYFGIYEIMFKVPYGNDSVNSDYDVEEMKYKAYMPTSFKGIINGDDHCYLYVDGDDTELPDGLSMDDITDIIDKTYMIDYKMDYTILDQEIIELSGIGVQAVQNTVIVKSDLENNFIGTYFVYNNKLYIIKMSRYDSNFSELDINEYEKFLTRIEEVYISNNVNENNSASISDDTEEDRDSNKEILDDTDENIERANDAKTLLEAKGYANPQVSIENGRVKVFIGVDSLSDQEKAQVIDTVVRKTKFESENIDIIFESEE